MGFLRLSVLSTLRLARKEKSRQKTDKDRTCPYLLVPSFLFVCVILTDVLYGLDIPYLNALPRCCRTYSYPKCPPIDRCLQTSRRSSVGRRERR